MKVMLRGAFNRFSGYGNDAVDIALWLNRLGVDVYLYPTSIMSGLPQEFTDLLTKKMPRRYDVSLQFLPPWEIAVTERHDDEVRGVSQIIADKHVAWSMWESDLLTDTHMRGVVDPWKLLDRMYVSSHNSLDAFKKYAPDVDYRLLPCGVSPDMFPVQRRDGDGPTKFVMYGQLHVRKNPLAAVKAYSELREEHGDEFDALLYLKTSARGLHPALEDTYPGVKVITAVWPWGELISWLHDKHVYLATSYGEGNNKPPMEFMATGGAVIATDWSGHRNWMIPDAGWAIDYRMVPVPEREQTGARWAEIDHEKLKEAMLYAHQNRREVSDKGMFASEWIRSTSSWEVSVGKLIRELEAM